MIRESDSPYAISLPPRVQSAPQSLQKQGSTQLHASSSGCWQCVAGNRDRLLAHGQLSRNCTTPTEHPPSIASACDER